MNANDGLNNIHQIFVQAFKAFHSQDRTKARHLAFTLTRLTPNDERPWLILAAIASPHASIFYINKALKLNPQSKTAQKGYIWASKRLSQVEETPTTYKESPSKPTDLISRIPTAPIAETGNALPFKREHASAIYRIAKFASVRGIALFASIVVSIFLIINIANLGGYLDTIQKGLISEDINGMLISGWLKDTPINERKEIIEKVRLSMQASYGLDQPYVLRSINWLYRGITFDWGKSRIPYVVSSIYVNGAYARDITSDDIRTLILNYLPRTLLLLGLSNAGLFLICLLIALPLARSPGRWANRMVMWLAPISSIPSWAIGLILLALIYKNFGNYSFKLGFNEWSSTFNIQFIPVILKGLMLPFLAILISKFFQSIYSWRNFLLIYSREDYIELAKAKGLPNNLFERRYLLRPALPGIITNLALIIISVWQECIAIEYFFNIGGIGGFFMKALNGNDITVVVALVATFAYLLALTVLILDIVYALIDPRIRIDGDEQDINIRRGNPQFNFSFLFRGKNPYIQPHYSSLDSDKMPPFVIVRSWFSNQLASFRRTLVGIRHSLSNSFREIVQYPASVIGLTIIIALAIISICTVIVIPYKKAISLWRGDDKAWIRNPRQVPPAWTNIFRSVKLSENIDLNSRDHAIDKVVTHGSAGTTNLSITLPFDFLFDNYPQDILILFYPEYKTKQPFVSLTWITPDGREIPINHFATNHDSLYFFSQDKHLISNLDEKNPIEALFTKLDGHPGEVLKGRYQLKVDSILFDEQSNLEAELIVYGQVYGIAGTDSSRRDLSLILLWGLAVALSFGILAAVGTTISSITLAATSVWFGGWIDGLIQRISEINMVLPMLPTCIMIFFLYSKNFWVILGVTVGLSIFGNSIKNYRAMFLQVVKLPYIEAAVTHGASNWRIIFHYMIPRIRHVLIPQLIILVPSYIFFETTLTFLGVSDPFLPTLGKLLYTIMKEGIFNLPGYIWIEAVVMLLLISIGFTLFGFGLERAYNNEADIELKPLS